MKHLVANATMTLMLVFAMRLNAQSPTPTVPVANSEDLFDHVQTEFLGHVVGHTIDTAAAREYLASNHLQSERMMPERFVIGGADNAWHTFDEEEFRQPGQHIAVLRFRADLVNAANQEEDQPDLYFTVLFVERAGTWVKSTSRAIWDIDPMLPPNDIRYGMRPFSAALGTRLNSLPTYP